jgi:hypothetical protein
LPLDGAKGVLDSLDINEGGITAMPLKDNGGKSAKIGDGAAELVRWEPVAGRGRPHRHGGRHDRVRPHRGGDPPEDLCGAGG